MRTFLPVILACLALVAAMGGWMLATAAAPAGDPAKTPATASPLHAPGSPTARHPGPSPSPLDNDAPARHLKRTACLKEARSKKLVGAQRAAYVKGCVGPA